MTLQVHHQQLDICMQHLACQLDPSSGAVVWCCNRVLHTTCQATPSVHRKCLHNYSVLLLLGLVGQHTEGTEMLLTPAHRVAHNMHKAAPCLDVANFDWLDILPAKCYIRHTPASHVSVSTVRDLLFIGSISILGGIHTLCDDHM